jgi:PemK-like, MazF-like toxin of type II toxin-antitoxin system
MLWIIAALVALVLLACLPAVSRRRPTARPGSGRTRGPASRRTGDPASGRSGGSVRGRSAGSGSGRSAGHGGRGPGPGGRTGAGRGGVLPHPADDAAETTTTPRPGEIWWADVPYEDGPGHKVRPCVVLRTYRGGAEVLKITSQDQSQRQDHVEIPTRTWDPDADHNSFLDLTGPLRVPFTSFDDRTGSLDAHIWQRVCELHEVAQA